jgi:hypothetical protein
MKIHFYFLISLTLIITLSLPACSPKVASDKVPIIDLQNIANTNWITQGTLHETTVNSQKGGSVQANEVTITVPSGALSADSIVSVNEFINAPPLDVPQGQELYRPIAVSISKVYDLGPAGIQFSKPVQVSITYDKSLLEEGVNPHDISIAYYNGINWISVGGLVDTKKGNVTISVSSFPGSILSVVVAVGAAVGAVTWAGARAYQYILGDPLKQNTAKTYITPNNPTVAFYTKIAGAMSVKQNTPEWIPLENPNNPGQVNPEFVTYAKTAFLDKEHTNRIGFGGGQKETAKYPQYSEDKNFQMPEEFFKTMNGDCTAVACAYASMLRRLGVTAYAVDGYKSNAGQKAGRHAWVEFVLDNGVYYYDDNEGIVPLIQVTETLRRPTYLTHEGFMWYELGQKKYIDGWWNSIIKQTISTTTTTTKPSTHPVITSFEGPNKFEFDSGFNVVGLYTFKVTVQGGTPPYYYIWKGSRAPQVLVEGSQYDTIKISPQDMRSPGSMFDGYFVWVTVKDSKNQYASWGNGSTEYTYGLKFTGKIEIVDGVQTLVENNWEKITEP